MLRAIYDGKAGEIDPVMVQVIGTVLEKQVFTGFGSDFLGVDFKTTDGDMLTRLTRDTWSFASAKNYQQLRDMSLALVSETGQARTFSQFEEAAKLINAKYNKNWLLTEYNQAIGGATMAARWNEIEKNADLMPYLRYSTVGDRRVRDSHAALDGVTRKITDEFWNTYFPPNGWGCRCSVDQLPGSKQNESKNIPSVPVPDMFKTNLAKSGLIYPQSHPYFSGIPDGVLKEALLKLPLDAQYKPVYKSKATGKTVSMHLNHGSKEMAENIKTASCLADNGYNVKLLPVMNNDKLREIIYGTSDFIPGKNPDALINGSIAEFKKAEPTKSAIHNAISRSKTKRQANFIVIRLTEKLEVLNIERYVKGKMNQSTFTGDIWVINVDGKPLKYDRKYFGLK